MHAELAAAGESHVLVLCTLRNGSALSSSAPSPDDPRTAGEAAVQAHRLVAWGCNAHGQLGCDAREDSAHPQFVAGLDGRCVTHLSAGATFSMAVVQHDPREPGGSRCRCVHGHAHGSID
jgi:hypothetical protein